MRLSIMTTIRKEARIKEWKRGKKGHGEETRRMKSEI